MPLPAIFLTHTCVITQRRTTQAGGFDAYGNPVRTETALSQRPCRFARRTAIPTEQGQMITAECILEPTTDAAEGDKLSTTTPGFEGDYWINAVTQVYTANGRSINHTKLELRETEHTQGGA